MAHLFLGALAREGGPKGPSFFHGRTMKESQITRQILDAIRKHGGYWVKIHGSAYQVSGLPDIIGCYRGRFVGLEVKVPGGENKLSLRQKVMLRRIEQHGGTSKVVTSALDALDVLGNIDSQLD
jgi:Archaeal holliday junction resolvase (hjc)